MDTLALIRVIVASVLFVLLVWGHLVLPGLAYAAYLAMVALIGFSLSTLLRTALLPVRSRSYRGRNDER